MILVSYSQNIEIELQELEDHHLTMETSPVNTSVRRTRKPRPARLHALLRRVFFLNPGHSAYVSVGIYPERDYNSLVEIGRVNGPYVLLDPAMWGVLVNELKEKTNNKYEVISIKHIVNLGKPFLVIKVDDMSIRLSEGEVHTLKKYLLCVTRQSFKNEMLRSDIQNYSQVASGSDEYITPEGVSACIDYEFLFDEIKSIC